MPRLSPGQEVGEPQDPAMTVGQFNQLRSLLIRNKYSQAETDAILGTSLNGRTEEEVMADLKAGMETPSAKAARWNRKH